MEEKEAELMYYVTYRHEFYNADSVKENQKLFDKLDLHQIGLISREIYILMRVASFHPELL